MGKKGETGYSDLKPQNIYELSGRKQPYSKENSKIIKNCVNSILLNFHAKFLNVFGDLENGGSSGYKCHSCKFLCHNGLLSCVS